MSTVSGLVDEPVGEIVQCTEQSASARATPTRYGAMSRTPATLICIGLRNRGTGATSEERVWIIQCNREPRIVPKASQPKNDNLRFARRHRQISESSMPSTFRSHLALEKKPVKFIESLEGFTTYRPALIRDPRDEQNTYLGENVAAACGRVTQGVA
jgi:hypothetical protein